MGPRSRCTNADCVERARSLHPNATLRGVADRNRACRGGRVVDGTAQLGQAVEMTCRLRLTLLVLAVSACGSTESGDPGGSDGGSSGATATGSGGSVTGGSSTVASSTTGAGSTAAGSGGNAGAAGNAGAGAGGLDGGASDGSASDRGGAGGAGGSAGSGGESGSGQDAGRADGAVRDASGDVAETAADAGTSARYVGCTFIGGIDRLVIAKSDAVRDLCFTLVLASPGQMKPGLAVPPNFGFERASGGAGTASCGARFGTGAFTDQVTGTVERLDGGPTRLNVDVTMAFAANDAGAPATERLIVQNLDVSSICQ